jgi:uncharacterized protein with ParB-like and HNH nuclease domain
VRRARRHGLVALFDSLLKGYPISSFLFWEIKPERRSDWEIYKFIENFRFGDTHNEMAEPDGRDVVLVLDGQQRLTSLLIGLRGSFTVRSKYNQPLEALRYFDMGSLGSSGIA